MTDSPQFPTHIGNAGGNLTGLPLVVEPDEPRDTDEVIRDLGTSRMHRPPTAADVEKHDALEWFLSATDDADLTHTMQINVGGPNDPRWLDWTIRPIDGDKLRAIRRRATSKQRRAAGLPEFDDMSANIEIMIEGTVSPDLRAAAKSMKMIDPAIGVRTRFSHKPGLVTAIANEILSISGYDDDDVRDLETAAKN